MDRRIFAGTAVGLHSHPTASIRIPIHLPVKFGENGSSHEDFALNVSTGGMFLKTSHYIRPGSELHLEFSLADMEPVNATAKVIWASEGVSGNQVSFTKGLGLQFIFLPLKARQQIESLTAQYRSLP